MEPGLRWLRCELCEAETPFEVVTLHDTGEALALGGADDVDLGAGFEDGVHGQLLAGRVVGGVGGADLGEVAAGVTPAASK